MNHEDARFDDEFATPPEGPRTSPLAVAALVCSCIICCPVTTLVGPFLGLAAIISINAQPHLKKGRGMAIAAIIVGLLVTIGWGFFLYFTVKAGIDMVRLMNERAPAAIEAGYAGDYDRFRAVFTGAGASATDQEIESFISQLRDRYGDFVALHPSEAASARQGTRAPLPVTLEFEGEEVPATLWAVFDMSTWTWDLESIVVEPADGDDIAFPPVPPAPAGQPPDG